MPTYEYACTACAHEWEFEQSIRAEPLTECPECHGQTARRQISRGVGFILKGSGWYSDLYSSPSNKKADDSTSSGDSKKTESSPKEASTSKSEAKSEAKADTKSESKSEPKPDGGSTAKKSSAAAA
jgi:putative FmdB family regulatory protein